MPRLRKARAVRPGDVIGIAAPGFAVDRARFEAGVARLESAGYRVRWREDVLACQGYLAGSDERRASELMELVDDPGPPRLIVPHPRVCERAFVLRPLAELVGPDWRIPHTSRTVADCLADPAVAAQAIEIYAPIDLASRP